VSTLVFLCAAAWWIAVASAQPRPIDVQTSTLIVRVYKAGILSAFGHDHEIGAVFARGSADIAAHTVEFRVDASALRVRDPKVSDKDREEIQKTMSGPDVLDVQRYPEIAFRSTTVEPAGPEVWKVTGSLTLHGQTRPVTVTVNQKAGHYAGTAQLKQTDFGIKPVRVAGGTVRVKDEIRIEFDVQLKP
jgi:polyisoprenoid-binding protein YceI